MYVVTLSQLQTRCFFILKYYSLVYFQTGFSLKPSEDTPLKDFLEMSLEKYLDDLTQISSQASKEYALEKVNRKQKPVAKHL